MTTYTLPTFEEAETVAEGADTAIHRFIRASEPQHGADEWRRLLAAALTLVLTEPDFWTVVTEVKP